MNRGGSSKETRPNRANFSLPAAQEAPEMLVKYENFPFYNKML
jgi:hypothetical protein